LSVHYADIELRLDGRGRPVKFSDRQLDASVINDIELPSVNEKCTLSDSQNSITSQLLAEAASYNR